MSKMEPEQFTLDRTDKLRNEIEGKIEKLDTKIDQKISYHVFYWMMGVLISLTVGTISTAFFLIFKLNDGNAKFKEQLIRIESKLDNGRHR